MSDPPHFRSPRLPRSQGAAGRHARLREATQGRHARAEALAEALGAWTTQRGYLGFLRAMYRFHRGVDLGLATCAAGAPGGWKPRRHSEALARDLEALGEAPAPAPVSLRMTDAAQVLGVLYVVEGSSLGARMLRPRVEALGPPAAGAMRFLAEHGDEPALWQDFRALLDTVALEPLREHRVPEAACAAFDAVIDCLRAEKDAITG